MSNRQLEPWQKALLRAANLIEERGLAKHTREDEGGSLCLMGAISMAAIGTTAMPVFKKTDAECQAALAVNQALLARGVPHHLTCPNGSAYWNNEPERTEADVVAVLREAAQVMLEAV